MDYSSACIARLHNRLAVAKETIAKVRDFLADRETGDALFRRPENWLRDVESYLLAGWHKEDEEAELYVIDQMLNLAEMEIARIEKLANDYGPLLKVIKFP